MPTTKKKIGDTRGGTRKGAGRPPLPPGERTVKVTVWLRPAEIAKLEKLGAGSVTAGVRKLISRRSGSASL